jgi:hypothetical protein
MKTRRYRRSKREKKESLKKKVLTIIRTAALYALPLKEKKNQ